MTSLSVNLFTDTVTYGGTYWAGDSLRWEAIRDSCWTFETGIGSWIENGTDPNKPDGYHGGMEGWFGLDQTLYQLPYFRRSSQCAIFGSFSLWAGVTAAEANALCWAAGQGYGDAWTLFVCKTFAYSGGNITLRYDYAVECEPSFDYTYVVVDTMGSSNPTTYNTTGIILAEYTGTLSGSETFTLIPGSHLPWTPRPFSIWLVVTSDGSYSDEDGLYPTTCGHSAFDNIILMGGASDATDFESGLNGWTEVLRTSSVGDFSNLVSRADLPPSAAFCPCTVQDSVLVFYDLTGRHPFWGCGSGAQDNIAVSPWIDLRRNGDVGRAVKLILYAVYAELPLDDLVFVQLRARFYPDVCERTGLLIRTPFRDQNVVFYYGEAPFCTPQGATQLRDFSNVIEPQAEQVQIAVGVFMGFDHFICGGPGNTTPWLDNIALGVAGPTAAPRISLLTTDKLQDSFAEDGTLNPAATGRLDPNVIKNATTPKPGSILRDTLVARGDGGNTEVRLFFQVRPGPFTNLTTLASRAALHWRPEPSIAAAAAALGGTWYSSRMDTAEQGGVVSPGNWMATFHENDMGFRVSDTQHDLNDPNQLHNEILPDRMLTPGSRVDYFIAARYRPPDPRNVGGVNWFVTTDTSGGTYEEVEILPSSVTADTTWNCVLYVDHHDDRSHNEQQLEEAGLSAALGLGGTNAEETRYDRWDVKTPSSGQLSLGRQIRTNYGCSPIQIFAYRTVVWHAATLASLDLTDEDASVLRPWLTLPAGGGHAFWGSGDGLVRSMNTSNEPSTIGFLSDVLGVLATCNTIRDANCPSPSALDSTYCLPASAAGGAHFATTVPTSAAGNGCPALRSFDLNAVNGSAPGVRGQLDYIKDGAPASYLSVTRHNTLDVEYRTVVDGVAVGALRTTPADPHVQSLCTNSGASLGRTADVLSWFGNPAVCAIPAGIVSVPGLTAEAPKHRFRLGDARPNPMTKTARIAFEVAAGGKTVRLDVYDVAGRHVKTLVDAILPEGPHEIEWNGSSDAGRSLSAGLYFYKMTAGKFVEARKVLILR